MARRGVCTRDRPHLLQVSGLWQVRQASEGRGWAVGLGLPRGLLSDARKVRERLEHDDA